MLDTGFWQKKNEPTFPIQHPVSRSLVGLRRSFASNLAKEFLFLSQEGIIMPEDIPPCHIRIDKEGNWYHQGLPIINKKIYDRYVHATIPHKIRKDVHSISTIFSVISPRSNLSLSSIIHLPYVLVGAILPSTAPVCPFCG